MLHSVSGVYSIFPRIEDTLAHGLPCSEQELTKIQKPAQYLGGEIGSIQKREEDVDFHFCLAFPDTYEVGMSHVGLQILYEVINRDAHAWAERAFQPLPDMEKLLRSSSTKLFSLESRRPLSQFDVVGFSLQYELCATGVLTMLDLGGIPLLASERGPGCPLVIGGGPVCYHPEPWADFFDAFFVGDGEELVPEFIALMRAARSEGLSREQLLRRLSTVQGIYVPAQFQPQYSKSGSFLGMQSLIPEVTRVQRRILPSLEGAPYPKRPLIPNIKAVHDRLSVEVMRGCVRGCRFCQAGYLYRPQRERKPEEILEIVGESLKNSGFEELSLLSLSTADYCSILPLLSALKERYAADDSLAISFPSTRVDALTPELLQEVQSVRRSGFTIAPEAGTQRLRDVINKGVSDEEIITTCKNVFALGWSSVKMYFMIGLPTETDEDILGIVDIARRVRAIAGRKEVTVSVSTLVPKPHTPFQWAAQIPVSETLRRQQLLRDALKPLRITFRHHDAESSFLEGVFARGDRALGRAVLRAYELGARLDGWTEELREDVWKQAFADTGIEPSHYLHARPLDAPLPWDHISSDIEKRYFLKEWERAVGARTTPDCLTESCSVCGACDYDAVRNVLFERKRSEQRLHIVDPRWAPVIEARERGETIELVPNTDVAPKSAHERSGRYSLREYLRTEVAGDTDTASTVQPVLQRVRACYQKTGAARYIGHLELATVFFRAARRAGVPLAYSRGFHPKPKLAFGPALPLGVESLCEYVDLFLAERWQTDGLLTSLNQHLPEGVQLREMTELVGPAGSVQSLTIRQDYEVHLTPAGTATLAAGIPPAWPASIFTRKRKDSVTDVRLGDYVEAVSTSDNVLRFSLRVLDGGISLSPLAVAEHFVGSDEGIFSIRKVALAFRPRLQGPRVAASTPRAELSA